MKLYTYLGDNMGKAIYLYKKMFVNNKQPICGKTDIPIC